MTTTVDIVFTWKITLNGTPLSTDVHKKLVAVTVENAVYLPDLAIVELNDHQASLMGSMGIAIGSTLAIEVDAPSGSIVNLFNGEVTAVEALYDHMGARTVVRGYDKSHRLMRGQQTKAWIQMAYSDIVTEIAGNAGVPVGQVDDSNHVYDHVTQAACDDWSFMRSLADQIGFRLSMVAGQLTFTQAVPPPAGGPATPLSPSPLTFCPGDKDVLMLRASITGSGSATEVDVGGFDPVQKQAITGTATSGSSNSSSPTNPTDVASPFGSATVLAPWTATAYQDTADVAAQAILNRVAGFSAEVQADVTGNPGLMPGTAVNIGGVGDMLNGSYVLATTRHIWDQHLGYRTSFVVSDHQDRSLLGVVSGGVGGGELIEKIGGAVRAVVTNNQDTEGAMGRVKLQYPWLSADYESDWARVVQPGAGSSRGFELIPEVNDEVLVVFEQGDVNHPTVIGALYNGVDQPPNDLSDVVQGGSVVKRCFTSRTGHVLSFDDLEGDSAGIKLATGDGATTVQLNGGTNGVTITTSNDVVITAQDSGAVTVSGANGVTVTSQGDVTINSGGDLNLQAPSGSVSIQGSQVSVSGDSGATLDGGMGSVSVTGTMVQLG